MLAEAVALYDVENAESFVQATLNASRRFYSEEEREELLAEGLAIMWKLADGFDEHRDGYEHAGKFSGYAAKYLRLKLEDAYHRLHPEHHLRTHNCLELGCEPGCPDDGKRRIVYGERAVSLHAMTGEDGEDRGELLASRAEPERPTPTVANMYREQLEERYNDGMRVAGCLAEGMADREIADLLEMTTGRVRALREDLEPIAQRLLTLNQR